MVPDDTTLGWCLLFGKSVDIKDDLIRYIQAMKLGPQRLKPICATRQTLDLFAGNHFAGTDAHYMALLHMQHPSLAKNKS